MAEKKKTSKKKKASKPKPKPATEMSEQAKRAIGGY